MQKTTFIFMLNIHLTPNITYHHIFLTLYSNVTMKISNHPAHSTNIQHHWARNNATLNSLCVGPCFIAICFLIGTVRDQGQMCIWQNSITLHSLRFALLLLLLLFNCSLFYELLNFTFNCVQSQKKKCSFNCIFNHI